MAVAKECKQPEVPGVRQADIVNPAEVEDAG